MVLNLQSLFDLRYIKVRWLNGAFLLGYKVFCTLVSELGRVSSIMQGEKKQSNKAG